MAEVKKKETFIILYLECGHVREVNGFIATQYKKRKRAYCIKCKRSRKVIKW